MCSEQPKLTDLPSLCDNVVVFLEGEDALALRCTCKTMKHVLDHCEDSNEDAAPTIWETFLRREFGHDGTSRLALNICQKGRHRGPSVFGTRASDAVSIFPSSFEAWKQWKLASYIYFGGNINYTIKAPYFLRAARIWARVEQWLSQQGQFGRAMQSSLGRGFSAVSLDWPTTLMSPTTSTLLATQAMLAFYCGQGPPRREPWLGFFGGFSVYDYLTCSWFQTGEYLLGNQLVIVALCTSSRPNKVIGVDVKTGNMVMHPSGIKVCPTEGNEAVLDWFDEYVRRLERGYYSVGEIFNDSSNSLLWVNGINAILHFPRIIGEGATRAVTNGVEVIASAVYSPRTARSGFTFVYSISIRLLTPVDDEYDQERGFESCQLKSRHWRITKSDGRTESVDGDGVVGFYPLLKEGCHRPDSGRSSDSVRQGEELENGTFTYQSCTGGDFTAFGGYMLFVPGTLNAPTGKAFRVHLATFPLQSDPAFQY